MQRIIALDIGSVRIGVAVSDPLGFFAQGVAVLDAKGCWLSDLAKIAGEYEKPKLLIGMPRRTDGSEGPEAVRMRETAKSVQEYFPDLEIEFWDERFTTTIAQQALLEADVSRAGRKKKVDKIAATLLLQSYLDRGR
ncbi:Holliday junction resolvase RuvX [Cloacibacillus evryensis]|uniref:Putative pre-16S rRNA nuclease n=2 Tax=root TaxID=1 RepID=A0AAW5K6G5_9BACT|nr:Holliday junction resolvase RuvX [Cloacibacillus evryensis]EHL65033.1 RNAse H-fold protein YqgF [Synergistes sp. 3_1_syn1]MCQ4764773.1 Holliday junction resolvase RuvX [Cloacibacillus evryensis]MCQ4813463.1 Holliday junction resolvase RuvX [Cloacibacillus evryensis]MEA5035001.1 Holliday junction resolvase RuvX [Cloacibacillus evryensis]